MRLAKKMDVRGRISRFLAVFLLLGLVTMISGCVIVRSAPETLGGIDNASVQRYFLKQKIWTLGDSFVIKDQFRNPVFHVKGKPFSIGDNLKFMDPAGVERLRIRQRLFSFKHLFKIYRNGELYAQMTKRIRILKDKFIIDVPGPDDYIIRGDLPHYHYDIYRNGDRVAEISKRWPAWTDHYKIEIVPGEDDLLILAAAVIVDMVSHRNDHHPVALVYP